MNSAMSLFACFLGLGMGNIIGSDEQESLHKKNEMDVNFVAQRQRLQHAGFEAGSSKSIGLAAKYGVFKVKCSSNDDMAAVTSMLGLSSLDEQYLARYNAQNPPPAPKKSRNPHRQLRVGDSKLKARTLNLEQQLGQQRFTDNILNPQNVIKPIPIRLARPDVVMQDATKENQQ